MGRSLDWIDEANAYLDKVERNAAPLETREAFAQRLTVSRQTLWRNKEISSRYLALAQAMKRAAGTQPRKATAQMRIRSLQVELSQVRRDNAILIQNFVAVCQRLRNAGLDPLLYIGDIADNADYARLHLLPDDAEG
ncbi:hypothetical protein ACHZ97_19030 [Lysobacter soli]|uniref:hypothetical protein n=1 Tax=Lysobacter soli TaxID=453783 RepID=UPI0037CC05E6